MADLSESEKVKLEHLLGMGSGYVLDFSNDRFQQFIYDSVNINIYGEKYRDYTSKAKKLRAFWREENNMVVGKLLEVLIDYYKTQREIGYFSIVKVDDKILNECIDISLRLQGKAKHKQKEKEFLEKEFDEVSIIKFGLPERINTILEQRIIEIKKCLEVDASLSVIFLSGSVLEGILLNVASQNAKIFNQASSSPKKTDGKTVKPFNEWSLSSFIDVAYELGYLDLDIKKHSHSLRDFRNYIHPYEQMCSGFNPDIHTAEIAWKVLKAAMNDILKKKK